MREVELSLAPGVVGDGLSFVPRPCLPLLRHVHLDRYHSGLHICALGETERDVDHASASTRLVPLDWLKSG